VSVDAVAAALAEFPELRQLKELHDAGWQFIPIVQGGEVAEVKGVRVWEPTAWTDAIVIRSTTDVGALRLDSDGCIVWCAEGGLVEVIDGLIMLPPPSARISPHLAIARGPLLWTPSSTGQH
jgi:hypothetical protein